MTEHRSVGRRAGALNEVLPLGSPLHRRHASHPLSAYSSTLAAHAAELRLCVLAIVQSTLAEEPRFDGW